MINQDFEYTIISASSIGSLNKKVQDWLDEMAKGSGYACRVEGSMVIRTDKRETEFHQNVVRTRVIA